MRVAIAGAGGMLGQDLVDACVGRSHEVFALERADLDVTDEAMCEAVMAELHPDAVVNCAAWTDVDGAEADEVGAMAVNELGAGNLAAAAGRHGARVAYISSDYVFDGSKRTPYVESDLPSPLSAYGRSKAAGETATAFANEATSSRRCCACAASSRRLSSSPIRSERPPTRGTSQLRSPS
jgi:dTDP-4-dehydrorhamnose reductase